MTYFPTAGHSMLIAYLAALNPTERYLYTRLSEIAKDMGAEIRYARLEGQDFEALTKAFRRGLDEADAFFMPDDTVLYSEDYTVQLHDRIKAGARVLMRLDENCLDRQNAFLAKYDLTGTRLRIRSESTPTVLLKRSADCFRDVRLFAGVEDVQIQHPNAIWYGGESLPVLVADETYLVVDGEKDLPVDWNARELSCIAAWHGLEHGGVLAMSGGYFHDPYDGPTGIRWLGIDANQRLAQNVIRYLTEGRPAQTPEDRCQRIEINLADFVFGILNKAHTDWWTEFVPLPVRQKCAQRQEEENNRLPKQAYFDLIDLKTVMHKNWALFEQHFRNAKQEGGKDKSLGWMDKLNELRRLVGHPLKKHVAGYSFTEEEGRLLREADDLAKRLLGNFRTSAQG